MGKSTRDFQPIKRLESIFSKFYHNFSEIYFLLPYRIFDGSVLQLKAGLPTKIPDSQYATTDGIVRLPKILEYS